MTFKEMKVKIETSVEKYDKHIVITGLSIFTVWFFGMAYDFIKLYSQISREHPEANSFVPIISFISIYLVLAIFVMTIIEFKSKEEKRKEEKLKNIIRAILVFVSGFIAVYSIVSVKMDIVHLNFEIETLNNNQKYQAKNDLNMSIRIKNLEIWQQSSEKR
jgi:cytochrome c oxidase assembly protein Cox11